MQMQMLIIDIFCIFFDENYICYRGIAIGIKGLRYVFVFVYKRGTDTETDCDWVDRDHIKNPYIHI